MSTEDLQKAFQLSAELLQNQSYHDLTQNLISFLRSIEGVDEVSAYEIFSATPAAGTGGENQRDTLVRRFPLISNDDFDNQNADVLRKLVAESQGGVGYWVGSVAPVIYYDVAGAMEPRRIVLIKGAVSAHDFEVIRGLFGVYSNQVALLDARERDPLTRLLNRDSMDRVLEQVVDFYHLKQPEKETQSSWLALLDIDHASFSHDDDGEETLLHVSALLKKGFRSSDLLFRFDGEEFVVIVNQTDKDGVETSLERFRKDVASHPFPAGKINVSIGFTRVDPDYSAPLLIESADQALYQAKTGASNAIVYNDALRHKQSPMDDVECY
ncbi:FOG: GGDEF domain [Hahella chejuensis KCTC 2396]|uniref:diguanylate cyclase n=1 Tax=Hahella chejuensis (strain KCTC 2396) TaxID=349521 RepID=Q2SES0_HAHCH|nr:GGDEF domain-containing protein [Hahella chejuensis]ABC30854.1 FOG: GGDEF domain [Hahella chejuensis KCTC 2396]